MAASLLVASSCSPSTLASTLVKTSGGRGGSDALHSCPPGGVTCQCECLSVAAACSSWFGASTGNASVLAASYLICAYLIYTHDGVSCLFVLLAVGVGIPRFGARGSSLIVV